MPEWLIGWRMRDCLILGYFNALWVTVWRQWKLPISFTDCFACAVTLCSIFGQKLGPLLPHNKNTLHRTKTDVKPDERKSKFIPKILAGNWRGDIPVPPLRSTKYAPADPTTRAGRAVMYFVISFLRQKLSQYNSLTSTDREEKKKHPNENYVCFFSCSQITIWHSCRVCVYA